MKKQLLILFTLIAPFVSAQVPEGPSFPGGIHVLDSFVQANFQFPADLKPDEAEGNIIVEFWVNTDGGMDSLKVIKNTLNKGADRCSKEAIRVFSLVADNYVWESEISFDKKIKSRYHYLIIIKQGKVSTEPMFSELEEPIFMFSETEPEFPGGEAALYRFVSQNVHYPKQAIENEEQGTVYVSFVVEPDGSVTNIEIEKSNMSEVCNEEALRVVKLMAKKYKWKPGTQRDETVRVKLMLPIKFQLM